MAFQYAEADINGLIDSGTITTLSPGPTYVGYPDIRFTGTTRFSRDGSPVVQSALADGRIRHWVWERYRPTVPGYNDLFNEILQLSTHLRVKETPVKSPWVFLSEDVTEDLGRLTFSAGSWTYGSEFVRVKVVDVGHVPAKQGGLIVYQDTRLSFVVDDPNFNIF